jgi:hypothetical protein
MNWQDEARRLHSEGLTPVQISKRVGKAYGTVRSFLDPEYRESRNAYAKRASKDRTARRRLRKLMQEVQASRIDDIKSVLKREGIHERDIKVQTAGIMTKILVRGEVRHEWSEYDLYLEIKAGSD